VGGRWGGFFGKVAPDLSKAVSDVRKAFSFSLPSRRGEGPGGLNLKGRNPSTLRSAPETRRGPRRDLGKGKAMSASEERGSSLSVKRRKVVLSVSLETEQTPVSSYRGKGTAQGTVALGGAARSVLVDRLERGRRDKGGGKDGTGLKKAASSECLDEEPLLHWPGQRRVG